MAKKQKVNPDFDNSIYTASGEYKERFGRVYEGMILNQRWQGLSSYARDLMVVILVHINTILNYTTLHEFCSEMEHKYSGGDGYFILTRKQLIRYGVNPKRASQWFKELSEAGFIDYVERNAHRKKANVYRLSRKWNTDN